MGPHTQNYTTAGSILGSLYSSKLPENKPVQISHDRLSQQWDAAVIAFKRLGALGRYIHIYIYDIWGSYARFRGLDLGVEISTEAFGVHRTHQQNT